MNSSSSGSSPARRGAAVALPLLFGLATGAALLAAPRDARAQSIIPVRVKLGIQNAQDGDVRNFSGSPLFYGEVDVALPSLTAGKTYISAGWMQRRSDGKDFRAIPLTVSRVYSPPNPASGLTGNPYFGAGVGAYLLRASGGGKSADRTTFGGFLVGGYQFPVPYFIEAKYHYTAGGVEGLSPNGLAILVGRRF